jgi:hypothetical protein
MQMMVIIMNSLEIDVIDFNLDIILSRRYLLWSG